MSINRLKSIDAWLVEITASLQGVVDRPRREALLLIMALLDKDELWLMTHSHEEVIAVDKLQNWVQRRQKDEPLEYITNHVSFYSQTFFIKEGALIPRPETELLIDEVLKIVDTNTTSTIVEVGVGSGVISIVLAQHLPHARFIAVDISPKALEVAKRNIEAFGLQERIALRLGDLLEPVREHIDILVSNPPYIARGMPLERNLDYEPDLALFGGNIGDEIIQRLLDATFERDIPYFTCEMGYDQKAKVSNYVQGKVYDTLSFYRDLAGLDRGFVLTQKESHDK